MLARFTTLLLVLLAALMFAACGGDDSDDSGSKDSTTETTEQSSDSADDGDSDDAADTGDTAAAGATLELANDGNELKFDKTELTASAGTVTIKFTNDSSIQHNVALEDADGKSLGEGELVADGGTSEVTADLKPGTYTYYCTPHKSAGMTGTLTVA
jgi:plastocyanin